MCAVWDNGVGYINDEGRLVIPCNFDLAHQFSEGFALVKPKGKNQGYGYIDKTGAMIINPIFNHAEDFKNGLAEVRIGKELDEFKYGYINKNGDYVWEPTG